MAILSRRVGVLVEVFEDRNLARAAINELRSIGFRESEIEVAYIERRLLNEADSDGAIGAVSSRAAVGLGISGLWGLAMLAGLAPDISHSIVSPVVTSGTLGLLIMAATAAIAVGGAGVLIDLRSAFTKFKMNEPNTELAVLTIKAGPREAVASSVLSRFDNSERQAMQAT